MAESPCRYVVKAILTEFHSTNDAKTCTSLILSTRLDLKLP